MIDALLDGWARWAAQERGPARPAAFGVLMRIASVRDAEYHVRVSDDAFTLLDSYIATLEAPLRQIVELEYRCLWRGRHWDLSQAAKWRLLKIGRTSYGKRLAQAQAALFDSMQDWQYFHTVA